MVIIIEKKSPKHIQQDLNFEQKKETVVSARKWSACITYENRVY